MQRFLFPIFDTALVTMLSYTSLYLNFTAVFDGNN